METVRTAVIWINFDTWDAYFKNPFFMTRILVKGYKWTPFVRVHYEPMPKEGEDE